MEAYNKADSDTLPVIGTRARDILPIEYKNKEE